jgi:hypothetical protein
MAGPPHEHDLPGGNRSDPDQPAPGWASFFGTLDRVDRFEAAVLAHFQAAGISIALADGLVHVRSGPDDGAQFGLMNLGQVCAASPESDWPRLIADHFAMMRRTRRSEDAVKEALGDFDSIAPRLVVRLWERADLPAGTGEYLVTSAIEGLAGVLSLDLPESIRSVKREEADAWDIPEADLFARALENVESLAAIQTMAVPLPGGGDITVFHSQAAGDGGYYIATLALRPHHLAAARGRHGALVALPVRHAILALPLDDAESLTRIHALIAITLGMHRDGPGSISRRIFWLRNDTYEEVPYEQNGDHVNIHIPRELAEELGISERGEG